MRTYNGCGIRYTGHLWSVDGRKVCIDVRNFDAGTVVAEAGIGGWSTAVLEVKYANDPAGPFRSFTSPITLTSAAPQSGPLALVGISYLAIDVTTAEGAAASVSVSFTGE
jgi:hypothetical protein